jgi:hypothetical protein
MVSVQVGWDPRPPVAVADSVLVFDALVLVLLLLELLEAEMLLDDFVLVLVLEVSTEEDAEDDFVLVLMVEEVEEDFLVGFGGFSSHTTQCWLE